ncbi:MAG: ADP-ribosylation factor family protein, partial [Candidatus Hermodarchaeota archaeon]
TGLNVDDALFGGFLAAIFSFSEEALKMGNLSTIELGSVRIRILPSLEENLIFSLAFDHDIPEEIASFKLQKIKNEFLVSYAGSEAFKRCHLPTFRPFGKVIDRIVQEEEELSIEIEDFIYKERLTKALASTIDALHTREITNNQAISSIINILKEINEPEQIQRIASAVNSALQFAQGVAPRSEISNLIEKLNEKLFFWGRNTKIFIFGIDQAGKTAIIQRMKGIENIHTRPTIGSSLEQVVFKQIVLVALDAAGQREYRGSWISLMNNSDALVYVIDAANPMRFPEAREELKAILSVDKTNIPLLFIANKRDLPSFQNKKNIWQYFELEKFAHRPLAIFETSAMTGIGLTEAFNWLVEQLIERWEKSKLA